MTHCIEVKNHLLAGLIVQNNHPTSHFKVSGSVRTLYTAITHGIIVLEPQFQYCDHVSDYSV